MSLDEKICFGQGDVKDVYPEEDVKQFIKERLHDATKLLALFNKGILNSNDLREHRQKIKNDAGKGLI